MLPLARVATYSRSASTKPKSSRIEPELRHQISRLVGERAHLAVELGEAGGGVRRASAGLAELGAPLVDRVLELEEALSHAVVDLAGNAAALFVLRVKQAPHELVACGALAHRTPVLRLRVTREEARNRRDHGEVEDREAERPRLRLRGSGTERRREKKDRDRERDVEHQRGEGFTRVESNRRRQHVKIEVRVDVAREAARDGTHGEDSGCVAEHRPERDFAYVARARLAKHEERGRERVERDGGVHGAHEAVVCDRRALEDREPCQHHRPADQQHDALCASQVGEIGLRELAHARHLSEEAS